VNDRRQVGGSTAFREPLRAVLARAIAATVVPLPISGVFQGIGILFGYYQWPTIPAFIYTMFMLGTMLVIQWRISRWIRRNRLDLTKADDLAFVAASAAGS
jgi:hypothetical protein